MDAQAVAAAVLKVQPLRQEASFQKIVTDVIFSQRFETRFETNKQVDQYWSKVCGKV